MAKRPHLHTTAQRGYGSKHQAERRRWEPLVTAGRAICWRCGLAIPPGAPWDLGHDDHDRTRYHGPEHRRCNRRAGGIRGNRSPLRRRRAVKRTTNTTAIRW